MSKKQKNTHSKHLTSGLDHLSSNSDFYSVSPEERPLNDDPRASDARRVRKTGRHQAAEGRRKETADPREKMVLVSILKLAVLLLLLLIVFFMLWKGIGLYEESIFLEHESAPVKSAVLQEVVPLETFDLQDQDARDQFGARIERWKEADRLVRSADALLRHNIYDQAIEQCRDALRKDSSHRGALERLGVLYYAKGNYTEAVNAYVHLLGVDPSEEKIQKLLIQSLDALNDYRAVQYMAEWYLDQNMHDTEIQRYLADALYAQEEFEAAIEAYGRVLRSAPNDFKAMELQAAAYMQIQQYEKALVALEKVREHDHGNPDHYKRIVICNAQLQRGRETVQALGRAAHLFGEKIIIGWIQDPQLDPVREDRAFQAFVDRVGGEEFRQWLEKVADTIDSGGQKPIVGPKLEMPSSETQKNESQNQRNQPAPSSR